MENNRSPITIEELEKNVFSILQENFSGWFSVKWLLFEYEKKYGEGHLTSRQLSVILDSMVDDGILNRRDSDTKRKKISYHSSNLAGNAGETERPEEP